MDQTTIFIKNILIVIIILFTVLYVPKFNYKTVKRIIMTISIFLIKIYL